MDTGAHCLLHKACSRCGKTKYYLQFPTKGVKRSKNGSRKNICRTCTRRKSKARLMPAADGAVMGELTAIQQALPVQGGAAVPGPAAAAGTMTAPVPPRPAAPAAEASAPAGQDGPAPASSSGRAAETGQAVRVPRNTASPVHVPPARRKPGAGRLLRQDRDGLIRMKGRSNNGKRWMQDIDWALAVLLVEERAAVVLTPYMIRRLYSNDDFRVMILERDRYICRYCGEYGDTIDHIVPRAKGGHTTPVNCVCSCYACNQSKADQDADEFMKGPRERQKV
ncbi:MULTISPECIES: HNH endonuclease [Paenibacillus]|uniref:HNH endonuclease n=1 Tax=Paenibacillus TaxID=44249 RepID=UPI0022B8C37B|nr:HNH endonuclease [Paenibacillus caseinilyticus]